MHVRAHADHSISDHMYRMAVLAMCTSDATLDVSKSVLLLSLPYRRVSISCIVGV